MSRHVHVLVAQLHVLRAALCARRWLTKGSRLPLGALAGCTSGRSLPSAWRASAPACLGGVVPVSAIRAAPARSPACPPAYESDIYVEAQSFEIQQALIPLSRATAFGSSRGRPSSPRHSFCGAGGECKLPVITLGLCWKTLPVIASEMERYRIDGGGMRPTARLCSPALNAIIQRV